MNTKTIKIQIPGEFLGAWLLMIGLGVWHGHQIGVPTIGYFPCLLILFGIGLITDSIAKFEWKWRT